MQGQGLIVADDIQELRERSDIVEIVSSHMKLKKAGRMFKGLCCFHQEKTPSFTVDPAKQFYKCFGCGAGGDVFTFLKEAEGLTFSETAERLADRLGMTLRYEGATGKPSGARTSLLQAAKLGQAYFDRSLNEPEGAGARRYLESRGFDAADAKKWGVGFSPSGRDTTYRFLLAQKLSSNHIVEAGLARVNDRGEHYDAFRGRLIFPVSDLSGQVVGFGARTLGEDQPKYLNSPESSIYHKSRILYGLDRARAEMTNSGVAVVAEGYTDVMALHKAGVTNAVATCGTALGEEHFSLIKRFCDRVILAFDSDAAGAVASERGFGIHSKIGLEVLVAPLPTGLDPADVVQNEGAEAIALILKDATPLMRFILEREMSRQHLDTAEGKSRAVKAAVALLSWEPSRVARSEHGFWVAGRIGVAPEQVQLELAEIRDPSRRSAVTYHQTDRQPGHVKVEREALAILLESPEHLQMVAEWLGAGHFTQPQHQAVFRALEEGARTGRGVMDLLPDNETRRLAAELALSPPITKEEEEVFLRLEEFRLRRQIETLRAKLGGLDPKVDASTYDSLFSQLMELEEQRRRFDDR